MDKERLRLMVKVCQQYFQEGLNQQTIASKYGISRSQVSRMITAAKSEGIVEITIKNPFNNESALEKEILKRFNLRDAIVVDVSDMDEAVADTLIAQAGAAFFESVLNEQDKVGVMAGKTITALAEEVKDIHKQGVHFVPLVGGWSAEGLEWNANRNASILAKNTRGSYSVLHAPALVTSPETKNTLCKEPDIDQVIADYQEIDIALIGIGEISESATHVKSTNMSEEDLILLKREGAVASIVTSFIGQDGSQLLTNFSERMIGISGDDLKRVPLVIAAARGEKKMDSIIAALNGDWMDVLVTDMETAKKLLN